MWGVTVQITWDGLGTIHLAKWIDQPIQRCDVEH